MAGAAVVPEFFAVVREDQVHRVGPQVQGPGQGGEYVVQVADLAVVARPAIVHVLLGRLVPGLARIVGLVHVVEVQVPQGRAFGVAFGGPLLQGDAQLSGVGLDLAEEAIEAAFEAAVLGNVDVRGHPKGLVAVLGEQLPQHQPRSEQGGVPG